MRRAITYLFTLLIISCVGVHPDETSSEENTAKELRFSPPQIPAMIVEQRARLKYITEHYWDNYDFADSLLIANDSITGSALAGYISLLNACDSTTVKGGISRTLDQSVSANYDNFLNFVLRFEDYLYDPNSPMRNEELFISVLRYLVESQDVADVDKLRPEQQLKMVLKNRVGEVAADFDYTLHGGVTKKMHNLSAKYTLLFFNTPGCEDCERVKHCIVDSELFDKLHSHGELQILAIYPESDLDLWSSALYDDIFINSYDKGQIITKSNLYDLRAIPTLYLLDNQKRVILKDTYIEQVEAFFMQNSQEK